MLDEDSKPFRVEALATIKDMFVYNMSDGKPRVIVGTVKFTGDTPVLMASRIFVVEGECNPVFMNEIQWINKMLTSGKKQLDSKRTADCLVADTPSKRRCL